LGEGYAPDRPPKEPRRPKGRRGFSSGQRDSASAHQAAFFFARLINLNTAAGVAGMSTSLMP
jgi:hypothetical protein